MSRPAPPQYRFPTPAIGQFVHSHFSVFGPNSNRSRKSVFTVVVIEFTPESTLDMAAASIDCDDQSRDPQFEEKLQNIAGGFYLLILRPLDLFVYWLLAHQPASRDWRVSF